MSENMTIYWKNPERRPKVLKKNMELAKELERMIGDEIYIIQDSEKPAPGSKKSGSPKLVTNLLEQNNRLKEEIERLKNSQNNQNSINTTEPLKNNSSARGLRERLMKASIQAEQETMDINNPPMDFSADEEAKLKVIQAYNNSTDKDPKIISRITGIHHSTVKKYLKEYTGQ